MTDKDNLQLQADRIYLENELTKIKFEIKNIDLKQKSLEIQVEQFHHSMEGNKFNRNLLAKEQKALELKLNAIKGKMSNMIV